MLSKEETDEHASKEDLAYKMLLLSWSLNENVRKGMTHKQFAKYALMKKEMTIRSKKICHERKVSIGRFCLWSCL